VGGGFFFTLPGAIDKADFLGGGCSRLPASSRRGVDGSHPTRGISEMNEKEVHPSRPHLALIFAASLLTGATLGQPASAEVAPYDLVAPAAEYKIYVSENAQ
jgi:hypothetical protein